MMCDPCRQAADSGDMSLHCNDPGCTCQHYPKGDSRVIRMQKLVSASETPALDADLDDSPASHSHAGSTPIPGVRERRTF